MPPRPSPRPPPPPRPPHPPPRRSAWAAGLARPPRGAPAPPPTPHARPGGRAPPARAPARQHRPKPRFVAAAVVGTTTTATDPRTGASRGPAGTTGNGP